jgi:hypothetical protein
MATIPTNTAAASTTRVFIQQSTFDRQRGQKYAVLLDGKVIVASAYDPEYAACRALVALGITGRLEVWRSEAAYPAIIIRDIEKAAGLTIREDARHGPAVIEFRPMPPRVIASRRKEQAMQPDQPEAPLS